MLGVGPHAIGRPAVRVVVYISRMLPLSLRMSIEVQAEDNFLELMFREPHKSDIEAAFHTFSASLVSAMDGRLAVGDYRIDHICNMPSYYHYGGQEPDDE